MKAFKAEAWKLRLPEEHMRTIAKAFLLVVLLAPLACAQNPVVAGVAPVLEAGLGYSYVDANVPSQNSLGMNGVQFVGNADFSRRFGVALDIGYARNFDAYNSNHTADLLTAMAGPVFYPIRKRTWNVYTHLLLGASRETGVNYETNGQIVLGYVNRFAWGVGGGYEYRFSRPLAFRVGADYIHTTFFNSNIVLAGQSNIRPSISLIYTFGEGREH
jgi:opacity protein-like surface antigen